MGFEPDSVAAYGPEDVGPWNWDDGGDGAHVGYIADEEEGASMGVAFVGLRAGTDFEFNWPYDEVCVVTRGSLKVRSAGELVTARTGEILTQPKGVPGTFEIDEDMEMVCVHSPTFAVAQGLTLRAFKERTDAGDDGPEPVVEPRGPQWAGGGFDPTRMQRFGPGDIGSWQALQDDPPARVGRFTERAEVFPIGLAVSEYGRGVVRDVSSPYDEVAAVTQGSFTVRSGGRSFRVRAGQLLYMPAGSSAVFEVDEDTVAVGLHHLAHPGAGSPA